MNEDFGNSTENILKIMENVSSLKEKIKGERSKEQPREYKILIWQKELRKAEKALDKRRTMA